MLLIILILLILGFGYGGYRVGPGWAHQFPKIVCIATFGNTFEFGLAFNVIRTLRRSTFTHYA